MIILVNYLYNKAIDPKKSIYTDNDTLFIKIYIIDTCDDSIFAKLFLNDSTNPNIIQSDFFLPVREKKRIIFGGTGEFCEVEQFLAKNIDLKIGAEGEALSNLLNIKSNLSKRNPECCIIC